MTLSLYVDSLTVVPSYGAGRLRRRRSSLTALAVSSRHGRLSRLGHLLMAPAVSHGVGVVHAAVSDM